MTVTVQLPQERIDDVKRRRGLMNLTGDERRRSWAPFLEGWGRP